MTIKVTSGSGYLFNDMCVVNLSLYNPRVQKRIFVCLPVMWVLEVDVGAGSEVYVSRKVWSVDVLWLGMDQGEEKTGANISVCHATLPS